jgi:ubiquinol-cytochrome c reductase cytochrome c1 subunit
MTDRLRFTVAAFGLLLWGTLACASEEAGWMQHANNDLTSEASLQRGARYYVNYCLGCHSARYVRYSRIGTDLGITTDQLIENLMFTADKPQRTMEIAMPAADAKRWFGRTPPDLSLVARSRGADWIYNYLRSFHVDESRQWGVDNLALPGAAMPNVLWELQGLQRAVFREEKDAAGHPHQVFERFEPVTQGTLTPAEFDGVVRDIVNFLEYIGEPMQLERRSLGLRVLAFLLVFFVLAYALKKEFWKDVH